MRVWTIQPLAVWEALEQAGELAVDPTKRLPLCKTPYPLTWLVEQLQEFIPGYTGGLPWWAYEAKPDLRRHRHSNYGPQVRIELELEFGTYRAFPIWAWDRVFSSQGLFADAEWEGGWTDAPPSEVLESWPRLFDPDLARTGQGSLIGRQTEREVVFEFLKLSEVVRVDHFVGVWKLLGEVLKKVSWYQGPYL